MVEQQHTHRQNRGHNQHDEFFKQTFKRPKWLLELLQVIFPSKLNDAFAPDSLNIKDSLLQKLGKGEMRTDLSAAVHLRAKLLVL